MGLFDVRQAAAPAFIRNLHVGGELTYYDPDKPAKTNATATCQHCGYIEDIPPGMYPEDVMGRCYYCWDSGKGGHALGGLICRGRGPEDKTGGCVGLGFCPAHEATLNRHLEKARAVADYFECR